MFFFCVVANKINAENINEWIKLVSFTVVLLLLLAKGKQHLRMTEK